MRCFGRVRCIGCGVLGVCWVWEVCVLYKVVKEYGFKRLPILYYFLINSSNLLIENLFPSKPIDRSLHGSGFKHTDPRFKPWATSKGQNYTETLNTLLRL